MLKNKKASLLFVLVALGLVSAGVADAQLNYTLLEKIPGTDGVGSDLKGYLEAIYRVALILVTLSAVLMISIGGFMYLTSAGNTSAMSNAKGVIFDALIGLVIALVAWLVLYVINPDLANPRVPTLTPGTTTGASGDATTTPSGRTIGVGQLPTGTTVELAKQILSNPNIILQGPPQASCNSPSGPVSPQSNLQDTANGKRMASCFDCRSQGKDKGCFDDQVRPSEKMLAAMLAVGGKYKYTVTSMSGGPHGTNSPHYQGRAIDIVPSNATEWGAVLKAFTDAGASPSSFCEDPRGRNVGCANPGSNTPGRADHIHIVFP